MSEVLVTPVLRASADVARSTPGLGVLLLFGSQARGESSSQSDWDFGYLAADEMDVVALLGALVTVVGSDRVDLVDLRRAGGLLRYRAARDGQTVFEATEGLADRFRLEASDFWCDAAPALLRGYDRLLAELPA
jgi:predicted nucleotidyltransferase